MIHLGDITKISGYTAPIVDCIVGGSPCQDLSVAGKRAGLDGERSGLFMDQVRIVKEMRDRDVRDNGRSGVDVRPRHLVWENVPGALSSGKPKTEDFRIVLEEIARIKDKDAVIPKPPNGKWQTSGCIVGDGWSIAWRVLDAQFWGVPQRRRRIALVADFGGHSASEILFVRKGVSGDTEQSQPQGKATTKDATRGFGADDTECVTFEPGIASREGGHIYENVSGTLRANAGDNQMSAAYAKPVYSVENHPADSRVDIDDTGKVQTLTSRMGTGGGNVPMVMEPTVFSKTKRAQTSTDYETWQESDTANTLNTFDQGDVRTNECVIALDRASYNQGKNAQFDIGIDENGTAQSLVAKGPGAVCHTIGAFYPQMKAESNCFRTDGISNCLVNGTNPGFQNGLVTKEASHRTRYTVRRLTPLECERLQGYPDGWTDIGEYIDSNGKKKQSSDASRYKALGNSIAIPPWKWVMKRLCACYERDATLASLFDGIGGFPYIWEQINGKGSCLWASEIEEFPIAVTKVRIGE